MIKILMIALALFASLSVYADAAAPGTGELPSGNVTDKDCPGRVADGSGTKAEKPADKPAEAPAPAASGVK